MKYKSKMELYGLSSKNVSFQAKSSRSDLYLCRGRGCPGGVLWSVGGGGSSDFFRFHFSEVLFKQSGANLVRLNHCNKDKTRLFIFPTLFRQPSITTPPPLLLLLDVISRQGVQRHTLQRAHAGVVDFLRVWAGIKAADFSPGLHFETSARL